MDINKGLLLDVFDLYCYDSETNKLLFMSENLTQSSIKGTADESEVRNGRGNNLFATLSSNKTLTIECTTNAFSFDSLAFMAGTTVHTGTGFSYTSSQKIKLASGALTLAQEPYNSEEVQVFKDGKEVSNIQVSGSAITITGGVDGAEYIVMPYSFESTEEAEEIEIKAQDFPSACKVVLKGVERDANSKIVADMSFIFNRAKPQNDFSIDTSSELSAKDTTITLKVLNDNGTLAKIVREPIAE